MNSMMKKSKYILIWHKINESGDTGLKKLGARYERAPDVHQKNHGAHEISCPIYFFYIHKKFAKDTNQVSNVCKKTCM